MAKTLKAADELEATLNFPNITVKFTSKDPVSSLRELNKLLNTLRNMDVPIESSDLDDPLFFRFINLSDEMRNNQDIMEFLRSVNKVEENFKQKKVAIENLKILDFTNKSYTTSLDSSTVQKKISHLVQGVVNADYAVIHIIGSISEDEKKMLVDAVSSKLPRTEIKSLLTNKELLGKTVIEGVFFGEFVPEL